MAGPLLYIDRISKSFGAVRALREVSFAVHRAEIVALVGDNGAGKSTLVKIISGALTPDSGKLWLEGREVHFRRPADAIREGIETVYQHLALIEELDVADNVYLGREVTRGGLLGKVTGWLDRPLMRTLTQQAISQLHIKIPAPNRSVRRLSGGQRQAVAIGRAITWGHKLLILDEPTAALGVEESEQVLLTIEKLRDEQGLSMIVVSHNMQDVYRIADRVVVLRQGRHVATLVKEETTPQEIVAYITGAKSQAQPA
ncbi:MAG: sugar ABC transporter ATP-binding protein [Chloroflexi bacterium]|jgi:ABC-type sugar transport system ATPase subunit|nr:sugar ABC transporter ATP-binding protein [Chloroflexota bacterium]